MFAMNAMVDCHALQLKMPRLDAYGDPAFMRVAADCASAVRMNAGPSNRPKSHEEQGDPHVRDMLGHASISTTSVYLHAEDDRRHSAIDAAYPLGVGLMCAVPPKNGPPGDCTGGPKAVPGEVGWARGAESMRCQRRSADSIRATRPRSGRPSSWCLAGAFQSACPLGALGSEPRKWVY